MVLLTASSRSTLLEGRTFRPYDWECRHLQYLEMLELDQYLEPDDERQFRHQYLDL